jgi:hypothetical protein
VVSKPKIWDQGVARYWSPAGWTFVAANSAAGPVFTLSKEDSRKGSYDTGMRIQLISKIKARVGLTPKEAVLLNIARKKKLEQVISECPEAQAGVFRRICLETEGYPSEAKPSQRYHLMYSFWWSDEADFMAAATFGAPIEEWPQAAKIYAVIKDFKLVDLDRPQKQPTHASEPTATSVTPPADAGDRAGSRNSR